MTQRRRGQQQARPGAAKKVRAISLNLSALPIFAPNLFAQLATPKKRIQNDDEQDYPASGRHDRKEQAASPSH